MEAAGFESISAIRSTFISTPNACMRSYAVITQVTTMSTITRRQGRGCSMPSMPAWALPAGTAAWPMPSTTTPTTSSWWVASGGHPGNIIDYTVSITDPRIPSPPG